jgi:hypothetical protein
MKKSLAFIVLIFSSLFLASCYKKYNRTITVCDDKLFVEKYDYNSIDVAYIYLTDSSNFRIYVGKYDNEHGGYSFNCHGDSLTISESYEEKVINIRKYSLVDLRKGKEGF